MIPAETIRQTGMRKSKSNIPVAMDPPTLVRRIPLAPDKWVSRITPAADIFVLSHMGTPRFDLANWRLEIGGLAQKPATFTLDEIKSFPRKSIESFHQCAGFPKNPTIATRRLANVVWSGVSLADLLQRVQPASSAKYIWSYGLDFGEYENVRVENYAKDLPLAKAIEADTILAYEVNGEPLSDDHGFPLRLVVPGYYGTNWVKWISRIELADRRHPGLFTETLYNDRIHDGETVVARPVWLVAPESGIVSPEPAAKLSGREIEIWGWAWADSDIAAVEISVDAGISWQRAAVEPRTEKSWQRFHLRWLPAAAGEYTLMSRAIDALGDAQPMEGWRNSVRAIKVEILWNE